VLDCVIIGGGPAGLNAALVMGRAGRKTILFDEDKPRNRVTQESHGFITQDGVKPSEFKKRARTDVQKYRSVSIKEERVEIIEKASGVFRIQTKGGTDYMAKKVLLATGLRDVLPEIPGIQNVYGTSVFSCPFCDGWEMQADIDPAAKRTGNQKGGRYCGDRLGAIRFFCGTARLRNHSERRD